MAFVSAPGELAAEARAAAAPQPVGIELLSNPAFDFDNCQRNAFLQSTGFKAPVAKKTGTTICGVIYKDGVVLGADTRATEGSIVADKNCAKIHYISKYIYCCGAGTAADTENVTDVIASQLELHRLATGQEPRVNTAMTRLKQKLFQYQGHVSAALVLGGVDVEGSHLYTVYPHGSVDRLPYATMGSGSLAAMAVLEAGYKDDLDEAAAVELVSQAIQSGIFNDLGSGSNVDVTVIRRGKTVGESEVKYLRNLVTPNPRLYQRKAGYNFPKGSTEWLKETEKIFRTQITYEKQNTAVAEKGADQAHMEIK